MGMVSLDWVHFLLQINVAKLTWNFLFVSFVDEHLQRYRPNSRDILNQIQLHV